MMIPDKLRVEHLNKVFINKTTGEEVLALKNINFSISNNEFLAILGPSGCGKTTMLRIIQGLETASNGDVFINGIPLQEAPNNRGFVFQQYGLLPWRTIMKNIEYGLEVQGKPAKERAEVAKHYLQLVGLESFGNHYPHQLSGGMQQRVGLARALAIDPEFILLDEPFGALDALTREVLQNELAKLTKNLNKTILFVTHSVDEALNLADRIMVLAPRPGRIREIIENKYDKAKSEYGPELKSQEQYITRREYILSMLMEYTAITD
jgi:NitT/TauT family transport system ATP-binding protein